MYLYNYVLLFLITIIFTFLYFQLIYDKRIDWIADNGIKYKIQPKNEHLNNIKANFLANINHKCNILINYMYKNNLPSSSVSKTLYNRFKHSSIQELPYGDKSAAYTINKGNIYICIMNKNKINDENDTFFVVLHELAHVMSNSYGHGKEFIENFDFIVKLAVKLNLWKNTDYNKHNLKYCGVTIKNSPCDNNQCSIHNINEYFQNYD